MNAVTKVIISIGLGCFLVLAIAHFALEFPGTPGAVEADFRFADSSLAHRPRVRFERPSRPVELASASDRTALESAFAVEGQANEHGSLLISIAGQIEEGSSLRLISYGRKPKSLGPLSSEPILVEGLRPGIYYVEARCPHEEQIKARAEVSGSKMLDVELELSLCVSAVPMKLADLTIELEWPENWKQMANIWSSLGLSMELETAGRDWRSSRRWTEPVQMEAGVWGRHIWNLEGIPVDDYELEVFGLGITFELSTRNVLSGYYLAKIEAPISATCSFHLIDAPNTKVIPNKIWGMRRGVAFSGTLHGDGEFQLYLPKGCGFYLELSTLDWAYELANAAEVFEATKEGQYWSIPLRKRCGVHFSGKAIDEYFSELTFSGPGNYVGKSQLYRPERHLYAILSEPGFYAIIRDSMVVASVDVAPGEFPDVTIER